MGDGEEGRLATRRGGRVRSVWVGAVRAVRGETAMMRHDYDDIVASRSQPWSWRREIWAALRRVGIAVLATGLIMLAFWLIFWIGAHV